MKAVQLRVVILANADLVLLHAALTKLRSGQALSAIESGVVAEASIANLVLVEPFPAPYFDGQEHVIYFLCTSG